MQILRLTLGLAAVATVVAKKRATTDDDEEIPPCRLWMAPSAVTSERRTKFGLFAGVDYAEDDLLPNADLAIPLVDLFLNPATPKNRAKHGALHASRYHQGLMEYLEGFTWTAEFAGSMEANHSSGLFVPGVGSLANYHTGFANVEWYQAGVLLREPERSIGPRSPHPARGAITPFHNMTLQATTNIPAGMELFGSFGPTWDDNDDTFEDKIAREDYENADLVVQKLVDFWQAHGSALQKAKLEESILDFVLDQILPAAAERRAKMIRSLIPDRPSKLQDVLDAGGTFMYRNRDFIKTPKWLNEHGFCVDKIKAGTSTMPGAGRGAFATRDIKNGEVIVPVPTIPIGPKAMLDMYQLNQRPKGRSIEIDYDQPIGRQILLNYCFGHPQSSMLLMPQGPMAGLINHGSLEEGYANAYVTWSMDDSIWNDHALQDENIRHVLYKTEYPNIVLSIEAIRDIKEGEEIFIDYQSEWVAAYAAYMEEYTEATKDLKWPLKAEDLRVLFQDTPYPVDVKESNNPYPPGVATACFLIVDEVLDGQPRMTADGEAQIVRWVGPLNATEYGGQILEFCDLVERFDDDEHKYIYNIQTMHEGSLVQVNGVPQAAITVVNLPYQSDIHIKGAFRHYIGIEDARWPMAWRDLQKLNRLDDSEEEEEE